jgi:hypothetical protein
LSVFRRLRRQHRRATARDFVGIGCADLAALVELLGELGAKAETGDRVAIREVKGASAPFYVVEGPRHLLGEQYSALCIERDAEERVAQAGGWS